MKTTIGLDEARRRVLDHARALRRTEELGLLAALGRTLARELRCDAPWPVTDRSAMDGFALRSGPGPGAVLPVVGEALAGLPFAGVLPPGAALRIMTGAVLPRGADAVVRVEDTSGFGGLEGDAARVRIDVAVSPGTNVRARGSELEAGAVVLRAGTVLRAAELGVLSVLGITAVPVSARPRVAIVSTGDELVDVTASPAPHQVRDSNSWAIAAQCLEHGAAPERLGSVADETEALRSALTRGLDRDGLITLGGASSGTHGPVHVTLRSLGVREVFHGVQLKPGKPSFFGVRDDAERRCAVFGLPGNPASAFTTFELFVAPMLAALLGQVVEDDRRALHARLAGAIPASNARTQAIPARLLGGADGALHAVLGVVTASGDPFGLCGGDALAIVPAEVSLAAADLVRVLPLAAAPSIGPA